MLFCHRAVLFSVSQTSKKNSRQANAEEEELRIQRSSTRLPQSKVCHRAVISAISQTSKKTLDKIKMKQKKESSGFEEAQLFLKVMFLSQSCVLFAISQTSENNMKQANEEEEQEQIRIQRSSTRLSSKCEIQQKKFSHTGFNAIGSNGKPIMNLDRLISSSSRTCTTLEFSLAQNHMLSSGQQGEEELSQEFGQSFFIIAFGSGDKMLHFFMVD